MLIATDCTIKHNDITVVDLDGVEDTKESFCYDINGVFMILLQIVFPDVFDKLPIGDMMCLVYDHNKPKRRKFAKQLITDSKLPESMRKAFEELNVNEELDARKVLELPFFKEGFKATVTLSADDKTLREALSGSGTSD